MTIILALEADLVEDNKAFLILLLIAIVMAVGNLDSRFSKLETGSPSHPNLIIPIMEAPAIHHHKIEFLRNLENHKKARDLETLAAQVCTILL